MQYIGWVYVFQTTQYLVQEIADVIVTQSLWKKERNEEDENLADEERGRIRTKIYSRLMINAKNVMKSALVQSHPAVKTNIFQHRLIHDVMQS